MDMTTEETKPEAKKYAKPLGLAPHEYLSRGNSYIKQSGGTHPYPIDIDVMLRNAGITNDKNSDYQLYMVEGDLWVERSKGSEKRYFLVLNEETFAKATEGKKVSIYQHYFRFP